jgi:Rps23 Pro-64 3,4-dihydroxylase Tpa1-like proline 4-hydroxylase
MKRRHPSVCCRAERIIVTTFRISPDLDLPALAREYSEKRRVRVHGLLELEALVELYHYLNDHDGWWHMMNTPDGVLELDRATRAAMDAQQLAEIDAEVHERARLGFQYRYEGLRVPEDEEDPAAGNDPLTAFGELMSSEPMLDLLRAITGCSDLAFTDGHATAYGPGDFLTGHDDDVAGKNRLAAYVFGMTPQWRLEWGGLLLFHGADNASAAGNMPRFNTLDLFAVPQQHSVSMVTPAAPSRRYAVTGWLRSRAG